MSEFSRQSDLRPEEIRARVDSVLVDADPTWEWSVPLVAGRSRPDGFELKRRGAIGVVVLEAAVDGSGAITQLQLRTRTVWSRHWPFLVNLAVISGGIVTLSFVLSIRTLRDFGIDVLVPLLSVIFTVLVIFIPAFWWMVGRHAGSEARWLLGYVGGLISSPRS